MLYLLHFSPRYRHAGHYLGYTEDLMHRFGLHLRGNGSPLVAAAVRSGSKVVLVRLWTGDGNAEQELKRNGSRARLCPICNPKAARRMPVYKTKIVYAETAAQAAQLDLGM
jgi:hypothetical protein